jgi:hypothetical protein
MENHPLQFKETSKDVLLLSLLLFFILIIAFLMPIQPNDYYWYMRIAAETIHTGAIPTTEILSYSQFGQPAIYQHWLSGMVFWDVNRLGGVTASGLVRGVSIGLMYFFLWLCLRRQGSGRIFSAIILLLAALAGSNNWAMRPQVLVYPLFGWTLWILLLWQQKKTRWIWALPVIALVWVNLHSSFICLFLALGAALVFGRRDKRLWYVLGVSAIASLISPYGLGSWTNALAIARNPSVAQLATEWQPPLNSGWQQNLFFLWLLVFPFLAGFSPRKLSAFEWILFLGFGWLALSSLRHEIWFIFVMAFLTAKLISGWSIFTHRKDAFAIPGLNLTVSIVLILSTLAFLPGIRQIWWKQSPPNLAASTPAEATAWLKQHPDLPGQFWSDLAYSSYLTYALPERPVWVYPKIEQFPLAQWEEYKLVADGRSGWSEALQNEGVNLVMASISDQPGLIRALDNQPGWEKIYADAGTVIYQNK